MNNYDVWMMAEDDPWGGQGSDPWAGRDTWVGDYRERNDREVSVERSDPQWNSPGYLGYCLDPWDFTYIVAIIIQILFIPFYAFIYLSCFRENKSVTKMHMFVFYINTSFWGWVIYYYLYKVACNGFDGTDIFTTACTFLGIFGLCSCCEMCCSREGGYFRHQKTMNECIQYMNNMKETPPVHRVEIECYHYRTEYHTDREGRTREDRHKEVTYREWRDFLYDRWVDESDYPNLPAISQETPIVAVDSTTIVAPGDDFTLNQFDNFRSNLVEQNRFRDWYIDETVRTLVPGHQSSVTAKSGKENEVPWWLNSGLYYFLAIICCSCPLRVLFRSRSKQHTFEIRKMYYLEPEGPNIGNMGVNVTVNIVDNKGTVNIGTNPGGMPMVQQGQNMNMAQPMGQQGQNMGSMGFAQPNAGHAQPYGSMQENPPTQGYPSHTQAYGSMQEKPPMQGYPAAQAYPSRPPRHKQEPGGYQPIQNPTNATPTAPPAYNPNMP